MMILLALAGLLQAAPPPPADPDATPTLEFVFEETVTLGEAIPVGSTGMGGRNIVPITGGRFEGPNIRGTILPGGWDWQLMRADGCLHIKADYMLRTDDGAVINVLNQGVACQPKPGEAPARVRTMAVFEPPIGKHDWLGKSAFVGVLQPAADSRTPAVRIRFYRVR